MKAFATLLCWLIVTAGSAQQNPVKEKSDSLQNIDNMPVLKGRGSALDMPTRTGKGEALPMPNRPIPLSPGEQVSMGLDAVRGQLKNRGADSLNRIKPNVPIPDKKN
ncbi:MAG: hypothetical protein EOO39_10500 [Cytophagaceae bacterium]|nr:MAG: hypothetical protein EOO39_10500 [Cytophagaceae bacterium]